MFRRERWPREAHEAAQDGKTAKWEQDFGSHFCKSEYNLPFRLLYTGGEVRGKILRLSSKRIWRGRDQEDAKMKRVGAREAKNPW